MYCQKCGCKLEDNFIVCPVCGQRICSEDSTITKESSHIVLAVFALLLCTPLGAVSFFYSIRANSSAKYGDIEKANIYADKAKSWGFWSIFLGVLYFLLYFFIGIAGALAKDFSLVE